MKSILLLDGEDIAWRCSWAAQFPTDYGDGTAITTHNPKKAIEFADAIIRNYMHHDDHPESPRWSKIIICYDAGESFRKTLYPDYKVNRAGKPEPSALNDVRNHLRAKYEMIEQDGLEADDIMGMLISSDDQYVALLSDKDLLTVPGRLYQPKISTSEIRTITPAEADRNWMVMTMAGDHTDNIPGIPGVGLKGALKVLGGVGNGLAAMWRDVLRAAAARSCGPEYMVLMARLTRILRAGDYDQAEHQVVLWEPEGAFPPLL